LGRRWRSMWHAFRGQARSHPSDDGSLAVKRTPS
jgi:hypothetical protein